AGRLVGRAGPTGAHLAGDDQRRPAAPQAGVEGADGRADGAVDVEGRRGRVEPQGRVHGGGGGLVQVRRADGGEPQRAGRGAVGGGGQRGAGGGDGHGRGVLVVGGDRALPPSPAGAGHRPDRRPVEPAVRQVRAVAQDPP